MEKLSLYRKYRPKDFSDLSGQDTLKTILENAIKSKKLSHGYIFSGPRGTGKTSVARLIAKSLNCSNLKNGYEPCNECDFCKDISIARHIDLIEIDAASNRGIEEIRDLKEKINFAPTRSKYKIYIIDEVHMLTNFAFNALLKTLEEPPSHAYFILATTELHKIPDTIISRCQCFDFKRISEKDLVDRLKYIADAEQFKYTDEALKIIAKYVNGGMRDAISLLEQLSVGSEINENTVKDVLGLTSLKNIEELYRMIVKKESKEALEFAYKLYESGIDLKQFTHDFILFLREKLITCVNEGQDKYIAPLLRLIEIFEVAAQKSNPVIPILPIEIAIIKTSFPAQKKTLNSDFTSNSNTKIIKPYTVCDKKEEIIKKPSKKNVELKKLDKDLNIENLKSEWVNMLSTINKTATQRCLKNGELCKIEDNKLLIKFFSKFDRDMAVSAGGLVEMENNINTVFGDKIKIDTEISEKRIKIEQKSEIKLEALAPRKTKSRKKSKKGSLENALDVFGGELVPES